MSEARDVPEGATSSSKESGANAGPRAADPNAALLATEEELARLRGENARLQDALEASRMRERTLADELARRVSNMLAVIRSIFRRTYEASRTQEDFVAHFEGRVDAIARYQRVFAEGRSADIELEDIIRDELLPTQRLDQPGCSVSGPSVFLAPNAIDTMALAIHELAMNAFKFGALRQPDGKLDISWWMEGEGDDGKLIFHWQETDIAIVRRAPLRYGFGWRYLEEALSYQLGASTNFEFKPGQLTCIIALPSSHLRYADNSIFQE